MHFGDFDKVLVEKPWQHAAVSCEVSPWSGMLRKREASLLFHLARDYYTGMGEIVDAGAFIGLSALSLAQGLHENPRCGSKDRRIHSFDRFVADDVYESDFIRQRRPEFRDGDSFLELYKQTIGQHLPYIEIHQGDFNQARWNGGSIEICFVDIAKTRSLNRAVCTQFLPHLIPGRSLVIHQDYHHPYLPWIHITMELLSEYFEIVDEMIDDSILFLNTVPIPASAIDRVNAEMGLDDSVRIMDQAINRLAPDKRQHLELARAWMKLQHGEELEFVRTLRRLDEKYRMLDDEQWHLYRAQMDVQASHMNDGQSRAKPTVGGEQAVVQVRYRDPSASQVVLVWGLNDFTSVPAKLPDETFLTYHGSHINTRMQRDGDVFVAELEVAANSKLEYGFTVTRTSVGGKAVDSLEGRRQGGSLLLDNDYRRVE